MSSTKKPTIKQRETLSLDDIEAAGLRFTGAPDPVEAPAAPEETSTVRRLLGDTGVSLLKGAIGVPEAIVGVADLVTGGRAGRAAEAAGFRPKEAKQVLDDYYSPAQKAANAEVQQAQGVGDTLVTALQNPSTIAHAAIESAPSLLPAGAVARGVMSVAPRVGGAIAAGIGEGAVSGGQTAEQIRQETPDGTLTAGQSALAVGSGALTSLLTGVAGKVANRLGIGDVNQLVAGVQRSDPAIQKGVVRSIVQGFATEGLLQELPQSAQEQIAQNVALGKPWDEGVGNAAVMGALAGGLMGGGVAPFHGAPSTAQQIRDTKLPETGTLTKGINAGIEATAAAAENAGPREPLPQFGFESAEKATSFAAGLGLSLTPVQKSDGSWSFFDMDGEELASGPVGSITAGAPGAAPSGKPRAGAGGDADAAASRVAAIKEDLAAPGVMDLMRKEFGAEGARDLLHVLAMIEAGRLPPRTAQLMLDGAERRMFALRTTVIQPPAQPLQITAAPTPLQLGAAPAVPALGFDTSPTGTVRVDGQGVATPETRAQAIDSAQAAGQVVDMDRQTPWGTESPPAAAPALGAPPALTYDQSPTGVLVADPSGGVRPQTRADVINRNQAAAEREALGKQTAKGAAAAPEPAPPRARPLAIAFDQTPTGRLVADEGGTVRAETRADAINLAQEQRRRADLGLTPDVERASMRAAMGNQTLPDDLTAAGGMPFRNRSAARAAAARAGQGHEVIEIAPDSFVGRLPVQQETQPDAAPLPAAAESTSPGAAAPSAADEIRAPSGGPFRSIQVANRSAKLNPGFVVEAVDGGWVLRKPAAAVAGEPIDGEWSAFSPESGSLGIPRAEMPQIKAEHRGAMTNFLNARGIAHEQVELPAADLKPSQAEFSPAKVKAAREFKGGERSILVSADGHVLDGHHQWLAKLDAGEPVKAIRFDAKLADLLPTVREFPSAETAEGAAPSSAEETEAPEGKAKTVPTNAPAPADDGEVVASRGGGRSAVKAEDLQQAFKGMIGGWKAGPSSVTIVQSEADLPGNIPERLKDLNAAGITRALFLPKSKTVYVIADNVGSVEEAQFALLHEVYGHLGLRTLLGGRYSDTMVEIRQANAKLAAEAEAWMQQNGEAEIEARVDRGMGRAHARREVALLAVEEALADRAGRNEPFQGWRRFAALLQRGLRALGLDKVASWMEGKTQAEVMALLHGARQAVRERTAAPQSMGSPAAALSRDQKGDGPLLSRSPAAAVRQMTPDLVKDMLAGRDFKRVSWWHKSLGTMYDLAQKHAGFKRVFDEAQAYIQDTSFFANDAADAAPRVLPQLNAFSDFTKALSLPDKDRKAIAAPIFEGTLSWTRDADGKLIETDEVETAGVVFSAEELRERFKLDDRQVELYREFRAAVDRSLDSTSAGDVIRYLGEHAPGAANDLAREGDYAALRRVVLDHIETLPAGRLQEEIRTEVQDKFDRLDSLKARGYAPLMRFGQYAVRVVGKAGESKFFGLYESATDAARAARELAAEFQGDKVTRGMMSQEEFKLLKGFSPETLGLFAQITGTDQNEAMQLWLKQATSNRSALKRMIKRKGIEGYSDDVTRVLSSFITSNARAASQALHFGQIQKDVNDIGDGDVKDAAERLRTYIQNPTEEAAALRGFLFAHFMGGSIASAAVNMTQPFLMTMPYLSKTVGIAESAKILGESIKTVLDYVNGRLTGDLKVALMDAEKRGLVAPQELHQLQAMSMGRGSLLGQAARLAGASERISATLDTAGKRAMFVWGAPFAMAEQFNRRLTFIAAYKAAKSKGMPDPVAFAAQAVVETQGLYNKANRPEWARGAVGATLFTFKQYSIGYLEFMRRLWTAGEPGSAERADGRKAALFGMALLFLAAGAQGLPGADDLDDLIDTIGQKLGYDTNAKRWKRERIPQWLQYGFSALPGIPLDVAGRLGLGNLLPGTGLLRKDKSDKAGDVWEMAGAAGGAAQSVVKAADSGSIVPLLPVAIANALKGVDIARTGAYRDTKGRRVIDADVGDALTKGIGFQPAAVAAASRADGLAISRNALAKNIEAEIANDWAAARFEGDAEGEKAARARLAKWNADNPDTPIAISQPQIVKRVRAMRMTREQRIQKATPKELRSAGG